MEIKRVGVLGCGQMGTGIMQVFAQAGYGVTGVDTSKDMLERAVASIDKRLAGRVEKGKMAQEDKDRVMGHIRTSMRMEDLKDCDLIEEAVPEDLQLKKQVFAKLDGICKPEAIFGTNTSGLSVTDMAAATKRG
ncbi:MAG: 3-hydroxybutyryl-CoA dehydrogenase, partial [Deltaproteobacteria bacterium]|nr:3-hydroxybutyryl-CoA dehydrogenase [Deltaproteobacteria bacterium]